MVLMAVLLPKVRPWRNSSGGDPVRGQTPQNGTRKIRDPTPAKRGAAAAPATRFIAQLLNYRNETVFRRSLGPPDSGWYSRIRRHASPGAGLDRLPGRRPHAGEVSRRLPIRSEAAGDRGARAGETAPDRRCACCLTNVSRER